MANVMNMKQVRNNVSRNGFDLSMKRNFTAKCGELLPVMCKEVIPGDKVTIDLSSFTRTMPVNTAAFARIREYYDFFFVPFSHLWNRSNVVLSQMDYNQQHAIGLMQDTIAYQGEMPFITSSQIVSYLRAMNGISGSDVSYKVNMFGFDRAQTTCKLLEYLGYGRYYDCLTNTDGGFQYNLDLNAFGLLAYQKIYSDFYRDEQWEKSQPSTFNVDYMTGVGGMQMQIPGSYDATGKPFFQDYNLFDLRYCNWQKDLYHGILPNAQYGDTAVVPIVGSGGSVTLPSSLSAETLSIAAANGAADFRNISIDNLSDPIGSGSSEYRTATALNVPNSHVAGFTTKVSLGNISWPDASTRAGGETGLSILALRQYEFLQKWKEIVQSVGQNYKDQTKAIWGVDVSDHLSERCTYLGGINSSLDINEVVNTNLVGENAQAEIFGKGVGVANGKITFDSRGEFGYIMCIYHCMPIVDYTTSYVEPQYLRVSAEDFANPVFDRVGMQQISDASILNRFGDGRDFSETPRILGYVPRYADYKTSIDTSVGAFIDSMSHWVVSYDEDAIYNALTGSGAVSTAGDDTQPNPNNPNTDISATYVYLKVNPHLLDPIFVDAADSTNNTDQFLCSAFFDVKAVRNLDVDGLPY